MNIGELKNLLLNTNDNVKLYAKIDAKNKWVDLNFTVGKLKESLEDANLERSFCVQKKSSSYEPAYLQVFQDENVGVFLCSPEFVVSTKKNYKDLNPKYSYFNNVSVDKYVIPAGNEIDVSEIFKEK